MDTKELKVFAAHYIKEQDNLTFEDKKTLINFVKESNENQVLHLLTTGKMVEKDSNFLVEYEVALPEPVISKEIYDILVKRAESSGFSKAMLLSAAGLTVALLIKKAAMIIYKSKLSAAHRACKNKTGLEKEKCMSKFKEDAIKARISVLQKGLSSCAKTKNPPKCKYKIEKEIIMLKTALGGTKKK